MTKQEANTVLNIISDEGEYALSDLSAQDLMLYVNAKTNQESSPVARFLNDHDACLSGQLAFLQHKTCEAALRAAHRNKDYDSLEWFSYAATGGIVQITVKEDDYYGELRPVKDFIEMLPKQYRTTAEIKKKKAKKNVKSRRSR